MKVLLSVCALFLVGSVEATTVAIIDSGVDTEHKDFHSKIWTNPVDSTVNQRDEDGNGYQDDYHGWNFAEQNNLVIDRKYLGTFSDTPYKFFEIQGKKFLGTATPEEIKWMEGIRNDQEAIAELQKFGNFVHGTHVSGIAIKDTESSGILAIKLIPTEVKPFMDNMRKASMNKNKSEDFREMILKQGLSALAGQQMKLLAEIGAYVNGHKAEVANGSFGTGFSQIKMITDAAYKLLFRQDPSPEDSDKYAMHFMNTLLEEGKKFVGAAPKTLFVFAAGNENSDNDKYPTSPTNIKADNVISVAATMGYMKIAPFSNYGVKMVDVAAPGMLILSEIPGDEYLKVSGTSQASPYVANIAAKIVEANPKLIPIDVKRIIMGTVDKKDYLKEKVATSGIVNSDRAVYAAQLSVKMSLVEAVKASMNEVQDVEVKPIGVASGVTPIAMPSMFR